MGNSETTYMRMMINVLEKKNELLQTILELTEQQEQILKAEVFDENAFDQLVEKKNAPIEKIIELDDGFETLFQRLEQEFKKNAANYKEQVLRLQELITEVTELRVKIEALERKNKMSYPVAAATKKKEIKQFKANKQITDRYYKNMIGLQGDNSYFMDKRK